MRRPDPKRELTAPKCRQGGIPRNAVELAAGRLGRDEFVRRTRADYDSLARRLEGFWPLPRSVEHADIVQELLAATFHHARRWDPTQAPIGRFLVFNAMADTKKWLNAQRGARTGKDPSSFELLFDDVFAREEGDAIDPGELVPTMPRQDAVPLIRQVVAGVDAGDGESECLLALLFEEDDEEAVRTVIEGGVARSRQQAREMLDRAKARAMAILAQ